MTTAIPDALIPYSRSDRAYRFQLIVWTGVVDNLIQKEKSK